MWNKTNIFIQCQMQSGEYFKKAIIFQHESTIIHRGFKTLNFDTISLYTMETF